MKACMAVFVLGISVMSPAKILAEDAAIMPIQTFASGIKNEDGLSNDITDLCLSADGRILVIGAGGDSILPNGVFQVWDLTKKKLVREDKMNYSRLAVSADGQRLAVLNANSRFVVQNTDTGKIEKDLAEFRKLYGVAFQDNDSLYAAGCSEDPGTERLLRWDTRKWEERDSLKLPADAESVVLSADAQILGIGTTAGAFSLVDLKTKKMTELIEKESGQELSGIAFSGDGQWVAATPYAHDVRVFAIPTKSEHRKIETAAWCSDLAFFHDQKGLLTGGFGSLGVWDVETGKRRGRLEGLQDARPGTINNFQCLTATIDAKCVVAADVNQTIYVWNASKLAGRPANPKKGR